jgi:dihydroorotase
MIILRNVFTLEGSTNDVEIHSPDNIEIDATGLTLLPALIDAHVHFRTPGLEHKEDWSTASAAAIRGGITTVFDMPNTLPPTTTKIALLEKKEKIEAQLHSSKIPLRYRLYLGADKQHFDEMYACKDEIAGIKVFMGASTGGLVMDDDSSLHAAFSLASSLQLVLAVHAEDEHMIHDRKSLFEGSQDPKTHSLIRNREVAYRATQKAIDLCRIYKTKLMLLHISTKEEVELIASAKKEGLTVFAETTPHHLFLDETAYVRLGTKAQVNPPLRESQDCGALWQAVRAGVIDTIGSDHAPHTLHEKHQPYGKAPSGVPGVETTLPLLLQAFHEGKISLPLIVSCMRTNIEQIFNLPSNEDIVLVDLQKTKTIDPSSLKTKCGWSPYEGMTLKGWPVYTVLKGRLYDVR